MKTSNLRIIGTEEEESQLKPSKNIYNKIMVENLSSLKENMPIKN